MGERGDRLLVLLALAHAGGMIAYLPLLTLLLPAKVAGLAGEARVEWLGAITLAGAVAASVANLAFGWASDLLGTRRAWATAGLALTTVSYAGVHAAATPMALLVAIVTYQAALNMLLSPLAAWAADAVPDRRKGLLGGLFGAAPPIGALAGVIATLPALAAPGARLATIGALVALLVLPLLLSRSPGFGDAPASAPEAPRPRAARADFALLWLARLLIQVAGNVLFGFLLFYFQGLPDPLSEAGVARLSALSLILALPIALTLGRLSDRLGPRKPFLLAAAAAAALGLGLMATEGAFPVLATGYALFGCGSAVFLALHQAVAMQFLPSPGHRGRDLGVVNLANTLPAIIAPVLAVWLVPGGGFGRLLGLLAGMVALAGLLVLLVRRDRQSA